MILLEGRGDKYYEGPCTEVKELVEGAVIPHIRMTSRIGKDPEVTCSALTGSVFCGVSRNPTTCLYFGKGKETQRVKVY